MRLKSSRLAAIAAFCLSSSAVMAAGAPTASPMTAPVVPGSVIGQADAIITENGFVPFGQPMQKGSVIGSLARLGNKAFIVTIDAQTGKFLDARPTTMALPAMAPVAAATMTPKTMPARAARVASRARLPRRYIPSFSAGRGNGNPARAVAYTQPRRPVRRHLPGISLASLPRPSGFNRVLGPVYNSPGNGYFVIDPTLGAIALDSPLFAAAVAVSQGLLDPSVIGPGYSPNSGYQLGYRDGLNDATIGSLQQPLFVDPTQGPVFVNPATGQPVVYAPSTAPGMPPQAVPYVDPGQQQAFNQFADTIVNSATPTVTPEAANAAAQRLNNIPGLGTGQPLTDQQLGDVAIAINEPMPPGGFTPEQKQNLQTIADHLTPDAAASSPAQTQNLQQDIGNALGSDTPAVSAADQQAAQERVVANPGIGSGHPIGGQDLDDIATAMGVPTPPGGFSPEQRQNLQEIASHLTPADPQTLQDTAVNQAIEASPDQVNTKALSDLGQKDPSALDPNAVAAVAADQPGKVDPAALNDVVEANPADVSPEALRQAAMDNPGSVTKETLSEIGQTDANFDPTGITPAGDDVQQQVEANLNEAAQTIGQTPDQQPFMTFDSGAESPAAAAQETPPQPDAAGSTEQQPFMTFDSNAPAAAEATPPADANAAAGDAGQTFSAQDFAQPAAVPDAAAPTPPAPPSDAAAGQTTTDSTFSAGDFTQPDTDASAPAATTEATTPVAPDAAAPASTDTAAPAETTEAAAPPASDTTAPASTDQTFSAQDFTADTPTAASPDTAAGDQTTDSNSSATDAAASADTAPASDAAAPSHRERASRRRSEAAAQDDTAGQDNSNNDQTTDDGNGSDNSSGSDVQQDNGNDQTMDNGDGSSNSPDVQQGNPDDNTQMDNGNDNSDNSGDGSDGGGDDGDN